MLTAARRHFGPSYFPIRGRNEVPARRESAQTLGERGMITLRPASVESHERRDRVVSSWAHRNSPLKYLWHGLPTRVLTGWKPVPQTTICFFIRLLRKGAVRRSVGGAARSG